jgi:hypothetical protein
MAKELSKDGVEYQDGTPVKVYEGSFKGKWIEDNDTAAARSSGDIGVALVHYRIDVPKFSHIAKSGELKRVNTFIVEDIEHIDIDKAKAMYDNLDKKINGINDGLIEVSYLEPEQDQEFGFDVQGALEL